MDHPVEIELKLEFDPASHDPLAALALPGLARATARRLASIYFDTPDRRLDAAGYSLRIRRDGARRIQTVKAASTRSAGLFVRREWERAVPHDRPLLDARSGPLPQLFDGAVLARLGPLFITDIERCDCVVAAGGNLIEIAIDRGEVRTGRDSRPLAELELELKRGDPGALFDLARLIYERVPLRLGVLAKSERGHALVREGGAADTDAVRAEPVAIDRAMGAADAFAAIAAACIRHYRRNEDLLLRSGAPEAVHQARVALRRLRSAFWLFRPLLGDDDRGVMFAAELRWLAGELGEIRDIDVLLPRLSDRDRAALAAIRRDRFDHLRTLIDGGRVRMLPIELAEWLALGRWRTGDGDTRLRDRPIMLFAADRLDRLRKRIKRHGRKAGESGDAERHELRKDAKKLRYAAEFLAALYPEGKPRRRMDRFIARLEALQDRLGELNDLAAAPALLARLGLDHAAARPEPKEYERLIDDAADCFEAFIDAKRFWRD